MAAIKIGGELNFVDSDKGRRDVARHRLNGCNPIFRAGRLDFFFARNERNGLWADAIDNALIDLARQKAQRQADEPGIMAQHPLDREMGLARIGRPQNGCHAAGAGLGFERAWHEGRVPGCRGGEWRARIAREHDGGFREDMARRRQNPSGTAGVYGQCIVNARRFHGPAAGQNWPSRERSSDESAESRR